MLGSQGKLLNIISTAKKERGQRYLSLLDFWLLPREWCHSGMGLLTSINYEDTTHTDMSIGQTDLDNLGSFSKIVVVVHALIPELKRQCQVHLSELEASLVYIFSSRMARAKQYDLSFKMFFPDNHKLCKVDKYNKQIWIIKHTHTYTQGPGIHGVADKCQK